METYTIRLTQFEGPFDLLLFFIERDELDIHDVPIAKITKDFLEYIQQLESLNLDVASEFILVAATLMRIKAKMLIPRKEVDEEGNEIDGTAEIQKLYEFAGFDPNNPNKWDPSMAKPIEWIKIHNLPDHVYFSHAQHVNAGKVQCQSCHGEMQAMDEVKQVSDLSMGWCINCHRETKVQFNYDSTKGNKFYSIYEKFHNDIKSGKMDSVSVKDIGGLECQKCHY